MKHILLLLQVKDLQLIKSEVLMMRANSWADDMMDYLENKGKENWSHEDWKIYYSIEEAWDEELEDDEEEEEY